MCRYKKLSRICRSIIGDKRLLLLCIAALIVLCASVPAVAWLTVQDRDENSFTAGIAEAQVQEDFLAPYKEKSNIGIKNTGDIPVYVRASVSIYWQTDDGSILSQKPLESEDYEIMWSNSSNWQKKGDIYYYIFPIEPQEVTENLIDTCIQKSDNPDSDRKLVVDIYSQVIQAEPAAAVQEAWSVGVGENGKLLIDNTP